MAKDKAADELVGLPNHRLLLTKERVDVFHFEPVPKLWAVKCIFHASYLVQPVLEECARHLDLSAAHQLSISNTHSAERFMYLLSNLSNQQV